MRSSNGAQIKDSKPWLARAGAVLPKLVERLAGRFQNRGFTGFPLVTTDDDIDVEWIVVRLPRRAGWLEEFVAELLSFPGRHDDQVDALTQGLAWGRQLWSRKAIVSFYRY